MTAAAPGPADNMSRCARSITVRYLAAGGAAALAAGATLLIEPLQRAPSTLFFAAVMASAWWGGLGPGLSATVLSALSLEYFFLAPIYSLEVGLADAISLAVFVLVALLISSLNGALRKLEDELRRQARHKDRFLVMLAHQLGTPLADMKDAVETLRNRSREARSGQQELAALSHQIETMKRVTEELADVAAISQGQLRLLKIDVNLTAVIRLAVEQTRRLLGDGAHKLTVHCPPEPLQVHADPTRLEQIIINLLLHASRFTDPGGNVRLGVEADADHAVLRVRDTGIGFCSASLPHVLDLVAPAEACEDLRIGLSLVRKLVALHDGTITVSSAGAHKGSEYVVRLPLGRRMPEETPAAAAMA